MIIIKIGGGNSINIEGIIENLKDIEENYIIVHGANSFRDELATKTGYEKKTVKSLSGYTSVLSDNELISLQMMAYAGYKNKRIVELCQKNNINAIGLTGLDGKLIEGKRNRGIKITEEGKKKIIRDFSGKPKKINTDLLKLLLDNGYVPILTVPIIDENGFAINSENDDIVRLLQESLNADIVIHLIEASGFLRDADDDNSLISAMNRNELYEWEGRAEGRIKRKLYSLKKILENDVKKIIISDGRVEQPLTDGLNGKGTVIE